MGANHTTIKEEPGKDIKHKKGVADSFKCLHNMGMIKKLKDNFWFHCAIETYKGFCIGATTAYLGLWAIVSFVRLFV